MQCNFMSQEAPTSTTINIASTFGGPIIPRFHYRRQVWLGHLVILKTLFVAIGVLYAVSASIGQPKLVRSKQNFDRGAFAESFIDGIEAVAIYPFQHYTREMSSTLVTIADGMPAEVALDIINRGLAADPNSPHMLWLKTLQEMRRGELEKGRVALEKLEKIAYGWSQTKTAREIYEALLVRKDKVDSMKSGN